MSNYNKVVVTTSTYSVTDMIEGSTPICDTKILSGSSWSFSSNELPATVYYETDSKVESSTTYDIGKHRVFINGEENEKFNFIENKVVQDGLVYTDKTTYTSAKKLTLNKPKQAYEITFKCRLNLIDSSSTQQWFISESNGAFRVGIKSNGLLYIQRSASGATGTTTLKADVEYIVTLRLFGNKVSCFLNGKEECSIDYDNCESTIDSLWVLGFWDGSRGAKAIINGLQIYTRPLAPAEIQHNLSVLNNSPAIKELHTTDSTGKTSILKLASDEDHVEMSTGRTLSEEYMGVLKTMGKEFVSDNGSPVEVNNGVNARLISAEIQGSTVNNLLPTVNKNNVIPDPSFNATIENMVIYIKTASANKNCNLIGEISALEPSKKYMLKYWIYKNTLDDAFILNTSATSLGVFCTNIGIPAGTTGIFEKEVETFPDLTGRTTLLRTMTGGSVTSGEIMYSVALFEKGQKTSNNPVPFGLSSTQAIISNNGQQYPIYATEEDKANKKVILCSGVDGVSDTLALKENGSVIYTKLFNTGSNIEVQGMRSDSVQWVNIWKKSDALSKSNSVSEKILFEKYSGEVNTTDNHNLYGLKFPLNTFATLEDAQNYFNGSKFIYQLKTPTVTVIDKSIIPTILTHKTNILDVGGAVKSSSFKVTVPTTDGIKKEYTLTPINGWKGTAKANLLQTGDIGLVLDLTIPEQFNTLITNLPNELKPKSERTVLGYNGNTPVVVKIGTDGTVKLPVTTTGVVKLDDTYKL